MKPDQRPPVKRVIVDFSKLNDEILELLVSKYPYGYSSSDIIRFKNAAGEWVDCAEVRTDDTIYLVKVSKRLENAMSDYEDDDGMDRVLSDSEHMVCGYMCVCACM